ncbi:hypothetical protein GQ54DRAFT_300316, partial [Martensiomyces pterosporus]
MRMSCAKGTVAVPASISWTNPVIVAAMSDTAAEYLTRSSCVSPSEYHHASLPSKQPRACNGCCTNALLPLLDVCVPNLAESDGSAESSHTIC